MFSLSSKLQGRANTKMRKRWRLFHATDFKSLMYPCFTLCYLLGIFPYKINASVFEISKPRYIFSTIVICVSFIGLLNILYMTHISGKMKYKGVPRILERDCYYIFSGFLAVTTHILSSPRMRLLQTIMEVSSKLPPESYQKLSRLIHAKDLGFFLIFMGMLLTYFSIDIPNDIKIFIVYVSSLTFQMDMLYVSCVCVLKACFKKINDNLKHMFMINDEVYYLGQIYYKQRRPFLLIQLKALKKQHLMISNTVQMLNTIFSLPLLVTIIITFSEITFELYYNILYWQTGESMINLGDNIYQMFLIMSITYYFIKIILIMWVCETGKNEALQIGTTVHDVSNSIKNNEIKNELELFSLQILHCKNIFSIKVLTVGTRLLTAMVGNISIYLLILIQFLNIKYFCKENATNVT